MKVALFIPCLNETFFPDAVTSTYKILTHYGIRTEFLENQTCCGQPLFNSGFQKETIELAKKLINDFYKYDAIVAPSGSCISMIKNHYKDLEVDQSLESQIENFSKKVFELSEFLFEKIGIKSIEGNFYHKVVYHSSCHANRELKIHDQPLILLKSLKGIDLVEMNEPDLCCGFGGTFSYKFEDLSIAMTERKVKNISSTNAEFCTGIDSSCLMNIASFAKSHGYNFKTLHFAEIIARSLGL